MIIKKYKEIIIWLVINQLAEREEYAKFYQVSPVESCGAKVLLETVTLTK